MRASTQSSPQLPPPPSLRSRDVNMGARLLLVADRCTRLVLAWVIRGPLGSVGFSLQPSLRCMYCTNILSLSFGASSLSFTGISRDHLTCR